MQVKQRLEKTQTGTGAIKELKHVVNKGKTIFVAGNPV